MKFQTPKGTRDIYPEDAIKLNKILGIIRSVFEKYGFVPIETPAFESFELLSAKGGLGEAVKDDIYYFKDKSDRELGLRFDMTMPFARFVSSNPQLPRPFKRYAIGKVWRYDNPQALRYREFWQADIDIVGSKSELADAEIVAATCECFEKLAIDDFYIRVNSRRLLEEIFQKFLQKEEIPEAFRIIDKLEKIGIENVKKELKEKGINGEKIEEFLKISGSNEDILKKLRSNYGELGGIYGLEKFLENIKTFEVASKVRIDLSIVRGLEYYTGIVFEVFAGKNVSFGAGGRYDNLIEAVGGRPEPATGISFGVDRILEVIKERKIFNSENNSTRIFVANASPEIKKDVMGVVQRLRAAGIPCDYDLMDRNLSKQLEYANKLGIPYSLIVGKEELKMKRFKLRDMKQNEEKELGLDAVISMLKSA